MRGGPCRLDGSQHKVDVDPASRVKNASDLTSFPQLRERLAATMREEFDAVLLDN
jgi:hypothetical protein